MIKQRRIQHQNPDQRVLMLLFLAALALLFLASLSVGSVRIPFEQVSKVLLNQAVEKESWRQIILTFRFPKALTAAFAGAALAMAGLQMQTMFRNPLADPFILGINSGASLGVALAILGIGSAGVYFLAELSTFGDLGLAVAASMGAALVLALVLLAGRWVRNPTTLLILGLMFGYATSALVSLLIYFGLPERIHAYTIWSYGSFSRVTWNQLKVLVPMMLLGFGIAVFLPKPLNALLLGEDYAHTMGLNVKRTRIWVLMSASILSGTATAFCGPIGFLGVAVPHVARNLFKTSDHKVLIPAVAILGAMAALLADMIAQLPGTQYILPINVITSFFGAPFVLWIVLRQRKGATSFKV